MWLEPHNVVDWDGNAVIIQRGEVATTLLLHIMKKLNGCPETSQARAMTYNPVGNQRTNKNKNKNFIDPQQKYIRI